MRLHVSLSVYINIAEALYTLIYGVPDSEALS